LPSIILTASEGGFSISGYLFAESFFDKSAELFAALREIFELVIAGAGGGEENPVSGPR
tara:strand:+ start:341 stop:517 length:177 start_codon:yes stop_codon:yes gene_type:complete